MLKDLLEPSHLLLIALLVVLLFGWKKLPEAARSVGRSMRIFKSEMDEMKTDGKSSASQQTVPGETVRPPQAQGGTGPADGSHPDDPTAL